MAKIDSVNNALVEITVEEITTKIEFIEKTLGKDFLDPFIDGNSAPESLWNKIRYDLKEHFFASWWRSINNDVKNANEDKIYLSDKSLRFLSLAWSIETIKNISNISRLLTDLKNKNSFYSAAYEARVASEFILNGYLIEIVEESTIKGVKTCDFIAHKQEDKLYIECKSIEDLSVKESGIWYQLITSLISKVKNRCAITLPASSPISASIAEDLKIKIINNIRQEYYESGSVNNDEFKYNLSEINDNTRDLGKSGLFGISIFSLEKNINRNMINISVDPFKTEDFSNRINSLINGARKQLPEGLPNVLYIEIPFSCNKNITKIIYNAWQGAFPYLQSHTKRINAVILSYSARQNNSSMPLNQGHVVLPNYNAVSEIPKGLRIIGTLSGKENVDVEKGAIQIDFNKKVFCSGSSIPIFLFSSEDGKNQLNIWKTANDTLRLDMVCKQVGIVSVESEKIENFGISSIIKLGAAWSIDESSLGLYVNGKWYEKELVI